MPLCKNETCHAQQMLDSELADDSLDPDVAYDLVKEHLRPEIQPPLNLATFLTTSMDTAARSVIIDNLAKAIIEPSAYPKTTDLERRCINILATLYHLPVQKGEQAIGTSTVGSSEAIMLAVLAMKAKWIEKQRRSSNDPTSSKPNLVMSSVVHACWKKAAIYFDVEIRYVACTQARFVLDPAVAVSMVDNNTIGICCIFGTTYTGEYEDVKAVNDLLVTRNIDVPIHVDAASGGFVAPFMAPDLVWDFRLEKVVSINVSGHKYGLVYPGIGWGVWRSTEYFPKELSFNLTYLGKAQQSFTMNFSRSSSHVVAQYYQFLHLGRSGYTSAISDILHVAQDLSARLRKLGFHILSKTNAQHGIPIVAFQLDPEDVYTFDEFDLARELEKQGWLVPAYHMANGARDVKLLRVVCRLDFSPSMCDEFTKCVAGCIESLQLR